jgi:phosphoribosylformylglycinamidine synthase
LLVISEDAGVVEFNKDYAYVVALESHNHPSALDPYGGSATGIGGILRDVVCMGAQPVALVDPLFFGPLDVELEKVPKGTKHPTFLFRGVVKGIGDYGNRVGIPTVSGQVSFDESYTGNCLVNVGCIGIVKNENVIRSRAENPGDVLVYAGGRTGRDGIHGVTFASLELDAKSEEKDIPAVQLGDPITKEPLIHACIEIANKKLASGLKDFGGGGLSCVVSEIVHAGGCGAKINLEKIPLKVDTMAPWEIWVSESQERMLFSCSKENLNEILGIFRLWDVNAEAIGEVTAGNKVEVYFDSDLIYEMDLEFQIKGVEYRRPYVVRKRELKKESFAEPNDEEYEKILLKILSSQNVASKEWVIRQYDHEVRAGTVLKPLQGTLATPGPGDAAVIKPLPDSFQGLAITCDVNPNYTKYDPYRGSASAVEEAVRNLVSVNAIPHSMADCLNFGNPEKPEVLGDFYESCNGLYFVAKELGIPFVSGNVSLYNESPIGAVAPTPAILGVGIVKDIRKAVTMDAKEAGNKIYLIGKTFRELGGSEYAKLFNETGEVVPGVDMKTLKNKMNFLLDMMDKKLIRSCHDLSNGGLAVAISEMLIAGDLGAKINLSNIPDVDSRTDFKLFSESNGRWLVEIKPEDAFGFEKMAGYAGADIAEIGMVTGNKFLEIYDRDRKLIDVEIEKLRQSFSKTIPKIMEGEEKEEINPGLYDLIF